MKRTHHLHRPSQLSHELQRRTRLEALAVSIAGRMLQTPTDSHHSAELDVRLALGDISKAYESEYCFLHLHSVDGKMIERGYEWHADGLMPITAELIGLQLPVKQWQGAASIYLYPDIGPEPAQVNDLLSRNGVRAVAFVPLYIGKTLVGTCGLRSVTRAPDWSMDDLNWLKMMGEVIASALLASRNEEDLNSECNLLQAVIDAVPHTLYAKDMQGRTIATNRAAAALDRRCPKEVIGAIDFAGNTLEHAVDRNADQAVIGQGIPELDHEVVVADDTGKRRRYCISTVPLRDEAGIILGQTVLGRDITDQNNVNQALRENEARFRVLFDTTSAGIAILRTYIASNGAAEDFEFVEVNERYVTITQASRLKITGKRFIEVFGAAGLPYLEKIKIVADTGAPYQVELFSQGVQKHLYYSVCQMGAGYVAVIVIDITAAKLIEVELRKAEARYRDILENATIGVFRSTPDGRFLFVNAVMARIYGYNTPQEMLDDLQNGFPERIYADLQQWLDFVRTLNSVDSVTIFELQHRRKDGSMIWTRTHASTTWSAPNIPLYYDGFVEDITASKETEQIRQERERQFRFLAENMRDVIWTMDNKRRFTYISPSIQLLRGLDPEQAIQEWYLDPFTPESRDIIHEAISHRAAAEATGTMDTVNYLELQQYHVDGTLRWVELLMQALLDAQGRRRGFLGITRDITARKNVEEQLQYASTHDTLTGLSNRARFHNQLTSLCNDGPYPISVILTDVDGLKRINDQFGHAAGDELLRRVASVLTAGNKSEALVARYGGDEFVVLMPETNAIAARAAVLLVQAEMALHNARTTGAPLSIAIGVATTTGPINPDELMRIADERMYNDKRMHSSRSH